MKTTTRIYWQANDDGPDGREAQRNDGTVFGLGGHEDDTEQEVYQSLVDGAPGMGFGTITFERDLF